MEALIRLLLELGAGPALGRLRVLPSELDGRTHRCTGCAPHETLLPSDGRLERRPCTDADGQPAN